MPALAFSLRLGGTYPMTSSFTAQGAGAHRSLLCSGGVNIALPTSMDMTDFALVLLVLVGIFVLWGWRASYKYEKRRDQRKR